MDLATIRLGDFVLDYSGVPVAVCRELGSYERMLTTVLLEINILTVDGPLQGVLYQAQRYVQK